MRVLEVQQMWNRGNQDIFIDKFNNTNNIQDRNLSPQGPPNLIKTLSKGFAIGASVLVYRQSSITNL